MLVYRQWTGRHAEVELINDAALIDAALNAATADCGLRARSESSAPFFGIIESGALVAGARAELRRLDFASTGQRWPRAYGAIIDLFEPARRRFDPREFRYLRLSDVVATRPASRRWRLLIRDLLDRYSAHMALFVLDPRREACAALEDAGLFNRFSRLTRQRIAVLANTSGINEDDRREIRDRPVAIGPVDL